MKRIIALLLAMVMLFGMVACTGGDAEETTGVGDADAQDTTPVEPEDSNTGEVVLSADGKYPAETIKIGFVNYDTTAEQVLLIQDYFTYLQEFYNFEIVWSESLENAEQELAFIEQCAAAGCKAMLGYYNEAKSESAKLSAELGMYYWGCDTDMYEECKDMEYYLGGFDNGSMHYDFGYEITKSIIEAGCTKLIIMSGGKDYGVSFFIDRYDGIMAAIDDANADGAGVEVVYEVPGWPGTEEFSAHQTAALETDADGLIGTLTALMWLQPMQTAGKMGQIKIAAVDSVSETTAELMAGGIYTCIAAEVTDIFGMAIPMIINAVEGYGANQRNADGSAYLATVSHWIVNNVEDAEYFVSIEQLGAEWAFSIDDVKTVLGAYNPDLKAEDFSTLYSATSAEEIQARR